MRHRKFTFKIGKSGAHRAALLANAVCSLIKEGRIKTTLVRAKQIRRSAEKMITLGKRGDLHAKRLAVAFLRQPKVVLELFDTVAARFQDRQGGYTRIIQTGFRKGDAAPMCFLEWVDYTLPVKEETATETTEEVVAE